MSVTVGFYAVTALRLLPSILRILAQYNNIISFKDAINVVTKLGNKENDVDIQTNRPVSFSHEISFENICFRYENNWILKNLTLNIRKNKCIGIFGKSGQGKTTFVNILAGLLSPSEGSIKIDSNDISFDDIREKLGNMVSYVPQNIYLIDKALSSNIAFGQEEENIDYHAVTQTLRSADLSEFLDKEKQGTNVKIGERGVGISGGQRQRIGIARALYFNRDIIIFDEATSSLDEETENRICETIQSLQKDKTIIIISHRKKPLAICDEVYEMNSGHLIKI
jgi:ABC-type bacteriocin/lantibiotic exporter with double-glycine peptidase domain